MSDLGRRVSLDDRLSRVLEELIRKEPFDLECVKEVKKVLFVLRNERKLHNTKCVRSLCYGCRFHPDRLVTLALLLSHLIMKDENNTMYTGDMFLHTQKNFLATIERLFHGGTFKFKEGILVQILFDQLRNGALESEMILRWMRRQGSYSNLSEGEFHELKAILSAFSGWVQSTIDTSDEDDDDDDAEEEVEGDLLEDVERMKGRRGSNISDASTAAPNIANNEV
eukprot:m.75195 g.75195  ORF g.75195 m.75195 type:complete len:225 (-) comp11838_c2_seq1:303-977(-)